MSISFIKLIIVNNVDLAWKRNSTLFPERLTIDPWPRLANKNRAKGRSLRLNVIPKITRLLVIVI